MEGWVECWRCGVMFDPSDFIKSAPCADCQLDFPESWLRVDEMEAQEAARINQWIRYWYDKRYSDAEIGEAIGMSTLRVKSRREKMNLPGHKFSGDEKWRDPEAVRANLAKRMEGNSYRKGKKANRAGMKREKGRAYGG